MVPIGAARAGVVSGGGAIPDSGVYLYLSDGGQLIQYEASTLWDLSATSKKTTLDVSGRTTSMRGSAFAKTGEKLYISSRDGIFEYDVTVPFEVSSASYKQSTTIDCTGLEFNSDGTKMIVADVGENRLEEYDLTTAYDITTTSLVNTFAASSPRSLSRNADGTVLYYTESGGDSVQEVDLTTAYDLSTASDGGSFVLSDIPTGIGFKTDGSKMYSTERSNGVVTEYDLSTAFDVTTASEVQTKDFSADLSGDVHGVTWNRY